MADLRQTVEDLSDGLQDVHKEHGRTLLNIGAYMISSANSATKYASKGDTTKGDTTKDDTSNGDITKGDTSKSDTAKATNSVENGVAGSDHVNPEMYHLGGDELKKYIPGGYHRFKVQHKPLATWLCLDQEREDQIGVKIITADSPKSIVLGVPDVANIIKDDGDIRGNMQDRHEVELVGKLPVHTVLSLFSKVPTAKTIRATANRHQPSAS
ncbi:hypothetical protein F5Y06DRAFT_298939 [Hypoxylon sp. FL0890]|nr:hypothetical protein F5Y06DRAFT_298939 [Hypoxylon sp. FL0890]